VLELLRLSSSIQMCREYLSRFQALAGIDPLEGIEDDRALENAVREDWFIGARVQATGSASSLIPSVTLLRLVHRMQDNVVLDVRDLKTHFITKKGLGKAVDGVSFQLHKAETLALVGESGSGKTMTALSILRLNPKPASRIVGGQVLFQGEDLLKKPESEMRKYRGQHISMVLQDPMTALDPVFTIQNQMNEPLTAHYGLNRRSLWERTVQLLKLMHIPAPESRLKDYPHQLSGGMRQRVVGAIAISCDPEVIIADEPTTSLDVTIQAAYLRLLKEVQQRTNVAILFITHDLGIVARMCDRMAVMYAGRIVEIGDTEAILHSPSHPYTEALLKSVPNVNEEVERLASIEGQPPSIFNISVGCPFEPRCAYAMERCRKDYPPEKYLEDNRSVSCWRYDEQP